MAIFLVSSNNKNSSSLDYLHLEVLNSSGKALVVWYSKNHGNYDIRGRFVDMNIGRVLGSGDFIVSSTNTGDQIAHQASISNDKALIVWQSRDNSSNYDIRGRLVDMSAGLVLGSDFLVSSTNQGNQENPQVSISDGKALVVWKSKNNGSNYDIRGRLIDMSTGRLVGSGDFLVSFTNTGDQIAHQASISNGKALVVWKSKDNSRDFDIRGRLVDMSAGLVLGSSDFLVSSTNQKSQENPRLSISDGKALVMWKSKDNASNWDIRGRFINMNIGKVLGSGDFLASSTNQKNQESPRLSISGGKALVVWQSKDNGRDSDIRGRIIDMKTGTFPLPYGLNNFFTAPLLERDYELKASLKLPEGGR